MNGTVYNIINEYINNEHFYKFEIVNADVENNIDANNIEKIIRRYNLLNKDISSIDKLINQEFKIDIWLNNTIKDLNLKIHENKILIPEEYKDEDLKFLRKKIKFKLNELEREFKIRSNFIFSKTDKEFLKSLYNLYKETKSIELRDHSKELDNLRKRKCELRGLLESYQEKFLMENNRKVLYHKDLLPIESEYIEYKFIKNKIKQLEEMYK